MHSAARSTDASLNARVAYDAIAREYDQQIHGDEWMRSALQHHFLRAFQPGMRVLDVACGTGTDAIFLAQHGIHVLAVDASAGMIEQAGAKVAAAGLAALVETRVLPISELSTIDDTFDGAISAFAGLNTADLDRFADDAARLVQSRMVLHLLNRVSLWEWLGAAIRGHPASAAPTRTFSIGQTAVEHHLYTAGDVYDRYFAAAFALRTAYGLGAVRPPHTVHRLPGRLVRPLEWLDVRAGALPGLRDLGRFFVLDLQRRPHQKGDHQQRTR